MKITRSIEASWCVLFEKYTVIYMPNNALKIDTNSAALHMRPLA